MDLTKISILKKGNLFKEAKSLKENHASYLYAIDIFTAGFYRFFQSKILIEIDSILGQKGIVLLFLVIQILQSICTAYKFVSILSGINYILT